MCVLAPKGGTGKTTVSTNLASGLALEAPGEVVIVDLDFQFGDVASALRMTPEHTFADIAQSTTAVDVTTIKVFLTPSRHRALRALRARVAGRGRPDHAADGAARRSRCSSSEFRYVVIDTGSGLDEGTLSVLKLCTDLVLLTSTDVPSVRATRKEVEMLDLLGLTDQTAPLRREPLRRPRRAAGERGRGDRRAWTRHVTIPSSRAVPISVNQGTPGARQRPALRTSARR